MACRGRERVFRSGLPIREIYQRAGERGNGPHPAGDGDTRHLADRTRPSPGKTFRIILPPQTRRSTRHVSCPSRKTSPARAQDQRSAPVYDPSTPVYSLSVPFMAFPRLFAAILHLLRHPAPAKVSFPPFPPPPHLPDHPAGRTAGSARTRSRGQDRLSSKCNSLEEDLERRAPAKPLAGPVVDQIQNALKFRL